MNRRLHIVILFCWIFTLGVSAQINNEIITPNKIYSDRITDQDGIPLNGIQIRVKGTNIYTVTDVNGQFSINAKNGDVIVLSKNGRRINTYRLDGSIYYEVKDESEQLVPQKSEKIRAYSISKRARTDNSEQFKKELDSAVFYMNTNSIQSVDFVGNALKYASDKSQISQSYSVLGDVYMNLKQYDLAVSNYTIAVDNSSNTNYQLKLAKAF